MCPLDKCCYVLPLKRGTLILGIIDILLIVGAATGISCAYKFITLWIVTEIFCCVIYSIGVILLLVSVCVLKNGLVIPYMVTAILCMLEYLMWMGYGFMEGYIIVPILLIGVIILRIYFWICVFSWYMELKNSSN